MYVRNNKTYKCSAMQHVILDDLDKRADRILNNIGVRG